MFEKLKMVFLNWILKKKLVKQVKLLQLKGYSQEDALSQVLKNLDVQARKLKVGKYQ